MFDQLRLSSLKLLLSLMAVISDFSELKKEQLEARIALLPLLQAESDRR